MAGATISCRGLWKVFGPSTTVAKLATVKDQREYIEHNRLHAAVRDVSFEVAASEIFVIMGLSGSGKSTVLRMLSRLIEPTAGAALIGGRDILKMREQELREFRRREIGMVFQSFGLVPHFTVLENVAYPMRVQGVSREVRERRAEEVIQLVGLAGRERSYPRELSGGQQQRIGIARSLATRPNVWLLDEPFSALDPMIRRQLQDEFLRLQSELEKTIIFVTHDFSEAVRVADRIAIMRDGEIVQMGTPADILMRPVDDFVAGFTRGAPRDKVLKAGDIAVRGAAQKGSVSVSENANVQSLATKLRESGQDVSVVRKDGSYLGHISWPILVSSLIGEASEIGSDHERSGH